MKYTTSPHKTPSLVAFLLAILFMMSACSEPEQPKEEKAVSPAPPVINAHPASQKINEGNIARLSVVAAAANGAKLSYQWQKAPKGSLDFTNVTEATDASYTTPILAVADSGVQYRVVVTARNDAGLTSTTTSDIATISVSTLPLPAAPVITTQPASDTITEGKTATLSVVVTPITGATLSYQWQKAASGSTTFTDVAGATDASYTTPILAVSDSGSRYRVVVTARNDAGLTSTTTSDIATLSVLPAKIVWTHIDGTKKYANAPADGILVSSVLTTTRTDIKSVDTIPSVITGIKGDAFSGCTALTSVTIPASVRSIAYRAFSDCPALTNVRVERVEPPVAGPSIFNNTHFTLIIRVPDESVKAYRSTLNWSGYDSRIFGYNEVITPEVTSTKIVWTHIDGTKQYANAPTDGILVSGILTNIKTDIKSVDTIPRGVTIIGVEAFDGCTALASITIPATIDDINRKAFRGCTALTNLDIPDGVTGIGGNAFQNCTSLASVTLPNSLVGTGIASSAFQGCTALTSMDIPSSVKHLPNAVFYGCTALARITIPNITNIGNYTFAGCVSLTDITMTSVAFIGQNAFAGCTGFTSITIPASVTAMVGNSFKDCTNLKSVRMEGINPPNSGGGSFDATHPDLIIRVPDESVTEYKIADGWGAYKDRIYGHNEVVVYKIAWTDMNGTKRYTNAPADGVLLGSVLTDTVTNIKSIDVIPSVITSIGEAAFDGYTGLIGITISSSIIDIGLNAFRGCTGITGIHIPNGVKYIRTNAFKGCTALTSVTIATSVTEIETSVFDSCTALTSISLPSTLEYLQSGVFYGCTALASITIPSSVTTIGNYAFSGCVSLTGITIPSGVTLIGDNAFEGCTSFTSVTIPAGVTDIGGKAFYNCSKLASVRVERAVPPRTVGNIFEGTDAGLRIEVPTASETEYTIADGWSTYANQITGY